MEKITVIVPIFNAGPYLKTCLDSIINQTYRHLEILLINDGSTDTSASICEAYRKIDARIRVIHKKLGGGGVGATRNTALPLITGDYVLFVDNDDWLELDHIERLYQSLKETDSDIAIANFTEFDDESQTFRFHLTADDYYQKVYCPKEWFALQYEGKFAFSQCFTVPWCKLYKAKLFDNIIYPEDEKVEDDLTTWKIYLMADRIVYSNTALYYHRKRSNSVTKTVDLAAVYPLKSIEERITLLSMLDFDIVVELHAYRWRLKLHKDSFLQAGKMQEYQKCLQKLMILEKWQK
ncbi:MULTISPECIES: glycosyltransferase family 2 protein [unclassified Streptococcus]|uniref:glycosyltransferase family 2 protein n=1 Tax=unclassified Streptococcus TaxID=2608887 RepID=UPI00107176B7|nr:MULTISPECIES: glycosyltransferase family 2 protein [unclassified Streptococcus]MBF0787146.1 glycosyltransferase family 2 protein [Streptococcus sp. 19428wC2_LYSM12]MCQ9212138.1 glycosyltransferase [Streptococcus sp. B01]MCQ9213467.1 glycosyltransferase [Streptococcus sp. O1]TFV05902.1 glycosyltransferase family 2 protein [Streptococcus sp. LYSM12]